MKRRVNVFTTAAIAAAVLVGAVFVLAPQPAEAGGADCADQIEALIDATINVKFACGREPWTDECREATTRWFDAMADYMQCAAEPI
ncbi:MAG: hypothetical protein OXU63_13405 [Acidobacteriota bacterium]|nr:hypothetical protein [Acidobacteriota bacterium]